MEYLSSIAYEADAVSKVIRYIVERSARLIRQKYLNQRACALAGQEAVEHLKMQLRLSTLKIYQPLPPYVRLDSLRSIWDLRFPTPPAGLPGFVKILHIKKSNSSNAAPPTPTTASVTSTAPPTSPTPRTTAFSPSSLSSSHPMPSSRGDSRAASTLPMDIKTDHIQASKISSNKRIHHFTARRQFVDSRTSVRVSRHQRKADVLSS